MATSRETFIKRFVKFHLKNPHVYVLFKKFVFMDIEAGKKFLSARNIFERIRPEVVTTTGSEWNVALKKPFKLNQEHSPYYARLLILDYPGLAKHFTLK